MGVLVPCHSFLLYSSDQNIKGQEVDPTKQTEKPIVDDRVTAEEKEDYLCV